MIIRELRFNDFDDVVSNYYSYYDEVKRDQNFGLILYNNKPDLISEVDWFASEYKLMLGHNAIVMVTEENDHVVGLCDIIGTRHDSELNHSAGLGIAIKKEFRAIGIGKALLKESIEKAKNIFEVIYLSVFETNYAARHLYTSMGFREIGIRENAIKRNNNYINEIMMELILKE